MGIYNKVVGQAKAGAQPLGANTPIYITEFNTNWAFLKDCCRNDPTFAPIWNSMYVADLLNSVYTTGTVKLPEKLIYFAGSAYPYFCVIGVQNTNMDCLYSAGATPVPYPQYYAFQLMAGSNYLNLSSDGYMAKSVSPPSGGGGLIVTAFYNASQDAMLIINPTSTSYAGICSPEHRIRITECDSLSDCERSDDQLLIRFVDGVGFGIHHKHQHTGVFRAGCLAEGTVNNERSSELLTRRFAERIE